MLKKISAMIFLISLSVSVFAENKKIVIAATDWAPYTESKIQGGGFFTEICREAFARTGYVTEVEFVPWMRAVEMTKRGEYHAVMGASYTEERTRYFSYSKYYWKHSINFFARKDQNLTYRKLDDLCPARIGIFSGSFYIDRFKAHKCFTVETVPTIQQNIKKLAAKRIDLFIDSKDSVMFYLNRELSAYADVIEPLYPPLETDKIYIVFSKKFKDFKKIRDDFDRGIGIIRKDGAYSSILKKHGISEK